MNRSDSENSKAFLQSLLDSIPGYVWSVDKDMNFLFFNAIGLELRGLSQEDVIHKNLRDVFPASPEFIQNIEEIIAAKKSRSWTNQYEDYYFDHSTTLLFNPDGEVKQLIGISLDATKRIEMHQSLQQSKIQAEIASRSKDEFLSRVSHELRTPLNAIIGMTNIALAQNDMDKIKNSLSKVSAASQHLLSIMNDILDISNIKAGKLQLEHQAFQLETVLRAIGQFVKNESVNRAFEFSLNINPKTPTSYIGDATRLTQVIVSLLSNAAKFSPVNPSIMLEIEVGGQHGKLQELLIKVRDNGVGIDQDDIERIFDSFEQGQGNLSRSYEGLGLGLPIVKSIIQLMNGEIRVTSKKGQGSAFMFNCWLERNFGSQPIVTPTTTPPARQKASDFTDNHILVFEDVDINREIIIYMLADTRVDLDFTFDGQSGLKLLDENPGKFDLILMDTQMPGMSGYDAARAIRASANPHTKNIPIIAMAANSSPDERSKALAAGMNGCLGKPMNEAALKAAIGKFISAKLPEDGSALPFAEAPTASEPTEVKTQPTATNQTEVPKDFQFSALDVESGLSKTKGNRTLYIRLCKAFAADNAPAKLRALLEAGDVADARPVIAALKGASSNISAVRVYKHTTELETAFMGAKAVVKVHLRVLANIESSFADTQKEIAMLETVLGSVL